VPRHNRSRRDHPPRPLPAGWAHAESGDDGEWLVRQVSATQATKTYRCPGCDQEIQPGVPHVVVWPALEHGSVADRRHWHNGCWQARTRRGPTSRRW
jgi:hypothetical protein